MRQVEGVPVHADGDDGNDGDNTEDGGAGHGSVAAIYAEAEDHGDGDEEQGYHSDASLTYALRHDDIAVGIKLGCKGGGNNSGESSYDQNQGQVSEDDEETLCPEAHVGGDDFTDGFAVVADGGDQCTEIVNAAEEDTADEYPEGAGQPAEAEAYSCDRSGDRTGAGDRGEVVAHEYRSRSGNIVDAVSQTVSRGLVFVINAPLFAEPVAVDLVAEAKNYDGDDQEDKTVHVGKFFLSLKNRKIIYVKLILPRLMILTPSYNTA